MLIILIYNFVYNSCSHVLFKPFVDTTFVCNCFKLRTLVSNFFRILSKYSVHNFGSKLSPNFCKHLFLTSFDWSSKIYWKVLFISLVTAFHCIYHLQFTTLAPTILNQYLTGSNMRSKSDRKPDSCCWPWHSLAPACLI